MCVSRSGFYAWRSRPPNRYQRADAVLAGKVKQLHYRYHEAYGTRRLQVMLAQLGESVSRRRIRRIKRSQGLWTRRQRRNRYSRHSNPKRLFAPNRLQRCFQATHPNQVWVADVTGIWTRQGWLHLAVVMDLYARRIVAWASGRSAGEQLTLKALQQAIRKRRPSPGLIHHTDRGVHYSSHHYQQLLHRYGLVCSMSRAGDCYDKAAMESFFSSLKNEWLFYRKFNTRADAGEAIHRYIDTFYNRKRLHSTLGYCSPIEYELLNVA